MANDPLPSVTTAAEALSKSRGWLIFFGIFSLIVGMLAIAFPVIFSYTIAQIIGIFCVVSGVFSIGAVIFGHEKTHRASSVILALIRIITGLALIAWVGPGMEALTLVLAIFFVAEGITFIVAAIAAREHKGWLVLLLNGIVTIILGAMIFSHFPSTAAWVIGLLYGINSVFYGCSLLALAASARKPS